MTAAGPTWILVLDVFSNAMGQRSGSRRAGGLRGVARPHPRRASRHGLDLRHGQERCRGVGFQPRSPRHRSRRLRSESAQQIRLESRNERFRRICDHRPQRRGIRHRLQAVVRARAQLRAAVLPRKGTFRRSDAHPAHRRGETRAQHRQASPGRLDLGHSDRCRHPSAALRDPRVRALERQRRSRRDHRDGLQRGVHQRGAAERSKLCGVRLGD